MSDFSTTPNMPSAGTGLQSGIVKQLATDLQTACPVLVTIPAANGSTDVWAQYIHFYGAGSAATGLLPKIGDKVVLSFMENDPAHPVVLGTLSSGNPVAAGSVLAKANVPASFTVAPVTAIQSDEDNKVITIKTAGGNTITISDATQSIEMNDQNGNSVKLSSAGIDISSPKDISITATGTINIQATQKLDLSTKQDLTGTAGMNVFLTADIGITAKGSATAELSANGNTVVKGAMVMIN